MTCQNAIASMGDYEGLTEIIPNVSYNFLATNSQSHLFRMGSNILQSVNFTSNMGSPSPGIRVSAFRWDGSQATLVGSATIETAFQTFPLVLPPGEYIICIHPLRIGQHWGKIAARFRGYIASRRFRGEAWAGATCTMEFAKRVRPPKDCNHAIYFEITDGELPPGLRLTPLGNILGQLPNLDCLEDSPSPAVGWAYEENDGTQWPWGREWRFQVRAWVDAGTRNDAQEWFCIRVHNNWDFDQEAFMAQSPFKEIHTIRVVEPPVQKLPSTICKPCKEFSHPAEEVFEPQPLGKTDCLPCTSGVAQSTHVELIPIPLDLCHIPPNEMLAWYDVNYETVSDCCEVEAFKRELEKSPGFNLLRARAGYIEPTLEDSHIQERQIAITLSYQNYLQIVTMDLEDVAGGDMGETVREWQFIQNQNLPLRGLGHADAEVSMVFENKNES